MILAAALAIMVGLTLGLLGGGGSILMVPVLVYGLGLPAKTAIAASLLVVAATSLVALIPHARSGNVHGKTGFLFGAAGMAGAFVGGRIGVHLPPTLLLLAFALVMLGTAFALLRPRSESAPTTSVNGPHAGVGLILVEGTVVGLVAGMVGAGGGFLVVPALALLGGLPMSRAVGTSLLVISLQSLAGFAGYAGHVELPWAVLGVVILFSSVGALVGHRLHGRVPERALRRLFGYFVVGMGLFVLSRQVPAEVQASPMYQAVFVARWPFWAAGAALSAVVLVMLWRDNRLLGVSTGCAELCRLPSDPTVRTSWRPRFLLGIVLGGAASGLFAGRGPTWALGSFDALVGGSSLLKVSVLVLAGVLIGFGARAAGGCTSGHSIVGMAQGARSSLMATLAFMIGGFATTWLVLPH